MSGPGVELHVTQQLVASLGPRGGTVQTERHHPHLGRPRQQLGERASLTVREIAMLPGHDNGLQPATGI